MEGPTISGEVEKILENVISTCDLLESRWGWIERCCEKMPATLVHGDLRPKNLRVRAVPQGAYVCSIDWETTDWGVPAADLAELDVTAYEAVLGELWPTLYSPIVRELAKVGKLFRYLVSANWETERFVRRLRYYQEEIQKELQMLP